MQLAVDNLACRRAGRRVFDSLSFTLGPGEALAVTGRNGAGKSTLIAAIAGMVSRHAGEIRASGIEERSLSESLHLVGHRDELKASLSAEENLVFAAALLGSPGLPPADALARVGLPGAAHLPVAYLSAGQRRRVALARLLVARRPLWLLDEPLTALDIAGQTLLAGIMAEHLAAGGLILAATHAALPIDGARELRLGA